MNREEIEKSILDRLDAIIPEAVMLKQEIMRRT